MSLIADVVAAICSTFALWPRFFLRNKSSTSEPCTKLMSATPINRTSWRTRLTTETTSWDMGQGWVGYAWLSLWLLVFMVHRCGCDHSGFKCDLGAEKSGVDA